MTSEYLARRSALTGLTDLGDSSVTYRLMKVRGHPCQSRPIRELV